MNALAGGVFASTGTDDEHAELRQLVADVGQRSYDANVGRRGLPAAFDADLWRDLESTGLARLTSTPDMGAGPLESAVTLYGLARHAAAVPLAETDLLAAWLGQQAGMELPDGPLTVAVADGRIEGGRIRGTADAVPWGRAATPILVARTADGPRVGVLDAASGTRTDHHDLAGEPRDAIAFDVPADRLHVVDSAVLEELQTRGAWARCVQIVGALDGAAALSVEHCRERNQFGRPLSAFQAVQQSLAGMAGEIERARASVELAVAAAAEYGFASTTTDHAVTVAKITVGRVVGPVTTIAHQLHGAIGVTSEHPLWLFTLRAQSWVADYGSTAFFARRLGRLALAAEDPWDVVTGELTPFEITAR